MSKPSHPSQFSSAAARAVQLFGNKLPTAAKDIQSFFGALQGWNITVSFSEATANAFLSQYLTEILIPSIVEIEKGLLIDDEAINSSPATGLNPNKLINITLSRTIYTLIEMLWLIALRPRVLKDAKYPEQAETHFPTSLVLSADVLKGMKQSTLLLHAQDILPIVHAIDTIINHDRFAAFMRDRHLERVILTYFTLIFNTEVSSSSSSNINNNPSLLAMETIEQRLKELLVYPPSLSLQTQCVTVLRSVTRCGSEKIKRLSAKYLTQILLSEQGLVAIMQGYLEGLVDSPMCSAMQIQLAKSLATLPADLSAEIYLKNICDQMLTLWPVGLRENDKTLLTTLVFIVTRCTQVFPTHLLINFFYRPMLSPILSIANGESQTIKTSSQNEDVVPSLSSDNLLATREQVGQTLHFLVNFLSLSPPFSFVAEVMETLNIPMVITQLFLDSYDLNNSELDTKHNANNSYHMVQEWSEDILRRLFTMKSSLIPEVFLRSLSLFQSNDDAPDKTMKRKTPWTPKGKFQIHNDQSIDIVRLSTANDTQQGTILHRTSDTISANISLKDILSQQKHELIDLQSDANQDSPVTPLLQYWKNQSLFAQHVSAWLYLLQKLETYRYESTKPAANKRPMSSSTSSLSSSTLANKTKEGTVILQLAGCLSQCFVAVLDLYFSTSTSTSTSAIEEAETQANVSTVRVAVVVQRCLEEVPLNLLLCDGVSILRLLHAIIQNAAVMGVIMEHGEDIQYTSTNEILSVAIPAETQISKVSLIQEIHENSSEQAIQKVTKNVGKDSPTNSSALDLALNILSSLLLFNVQRRSDAEEAQLQAMIPDLLSLASQQNKEPDTIRAAKMEKKQFQDAEREQRLEVAQRTSDLALTIFKRRLIANDCSHNNNSNRDRQKKDVSDLDEALDRFISSCESRPGSRISPSPSLYELYAEARVLVSRIAQSSTKDGGRGSVVEAAHETAATRAFALRQLSLLMAALPFDENNSNYNKNNKLSEIEVQVLTVWREAMCLALVCLSDEDSFVYLNATLCLQRMLRCILQAPRHSQNNQNNNINIDNGINDALRLKKMVHIHLASILICCFSGVDRYRQVFTADSDNKARDNHEVTYNTTNNIDNTNDTKNDTNKMCMNNNIITVVSSNNNGDTLSVSESVEAPLHYNNSTKNINAASTTDSFFLKPISTTYKRDTNTLLHNSLAPTHDNTSTATAIATTSFSILSDTVLTGIDDMFFHPYETISAKEKLTRWRVMVGEVLCQLLRCRDETGTTFSASVSSSVRYLVAFQAEERRLLQGLTAIVLRELKHSQMHSSPSQSSLTSQLSKASSDTKLTTNTPTFDVFSGRLLSQKTTSSVDNIDTPTQDTSSERKITSENDNYYYQSTAQLYYEQSCLSILSEVLPLLGVAGHSVLHDVVHLCVYILRYESLVTQTKTQKDEAQNEDSNKHEVVLQRGRRRAAIALLRSIAEHYLTYLLHRDSVHFLTEIGSCLEIVLLQDHDEVVQYQADYIAEILQQSVGATIGLSL